MEALEEQMQIVRGHWGEGPFDFDGAHFGAKELDALPKPVQRPHPPMILEGGAARAACASPPATPTSTTR